MREAMMATFRIEYALLLVAVITVTYLWFKLSVRPRQISRPKTNAAHISQAEKPVSVDKRTRQPLEVLYPASTDDPDDKGLGDVDIIAVHGLGSNVDWSWTWKAKDGGKNVHWLQDSDMLPSKVPKARIIAYNYDSTWHKAAPRTSIQLCGEELIQSVHRFRGDTPDRPIIFIGHSLGGNVILNGLLFANSEDKFRYIWDRVAGLVFLGTPFRGTKWQPFVNSLAHVLKVVGSHSGITKELGFDESTLQDKLHCFCRLPNVMSTPISCFSELYETDYGQRYGVKNAVKGMIVESTSAWVPGCDRYTLQTDHLKMNKFSDAHDRSFLAVSEAICEMYENASDAIHRRKHPKRMITDTKYALSERPDARECLRSLFITDPHDDKDQLKRKKGSRAQGTCEWILNTESFTTWLGTGKATQSPGTSIFWLYGNPGKGKSTMAIFLVEKLIEIFAASMGKTLGYFFCEASFSNRRTATSILRGLIYQFIQQHPQLLDYVMPKYLERGADLFNSFDSLWVIFMAVVNDAKTGYKYCIIDALDECDQDSQKMLLQKFEETFMGQSNTTNVRILITSRPYPEIREYLDQYANEDLASFPEAQADIERCINERVADLAKRKHYTNKVKEQVTETLRKRAGGTFLWVGLACDELRNVPSKDAIQVLESLPTELHALYGNILKTICDEESPQADIIKRMLGFVVVAMKPLSMLQLAAACRLYEEEDDADTRLQYIRDQISACRLMVIIQDEKVLFLHKSVLDYLTRTAFINIGEWHAQLAYRCIDIVVDHFHNGQELEEKKLFDYARQNWPEHVRLAGSDFKIEKAQPEFFQENSPSRDKWLERALLGSRFRNMRGLNILHMAALFGLPVILHYFLNQGNEAVRNSSHSIDLECRENLGLTPLDLALQGGYPETVSLLLNMGAKVTENWFSSVCKARANREEVINILLALRGNDITVTNECFKKERSRDPKVLGLLLDRLGDRFLVTEEMLLSVYSADVMRLLFDKLRGDVTITESFLIHIIEGLPPQTILLPACFPPFPPYRAPDEHKEHREFLSYVLMEKRNEIVVTENTLLAIARKENVFDLRSILFEFEELEIDVSEQALKEILQRRYGHDVLLMLIIINKHHIEITQGVLDAAANIKDPDQRQRVLAFLECIRDKDSVRWSGSREPLLLIDEDREDDG